MNIESLKRSLERAEKYLTLVKMFKNEGFTEEEFEYVQANSNLLQKEMMRLGHGTIFYRRPFGIGVFDKYQIIANFPILLGTRGLMDEAINLIPSVIQTLLAYIQEVKELIENPEDLEKTIIRIDFFEIIKDIEKNFRKIVKTEPNNERDVQDSSVRR